MDHYDVDDAEEGIITRTKKWSCNVYGWYFILPNVTRDGKKGMILKITDGLTIKIDAAKIMHCSTWRNKDTQFNIYETYYGRKKIKVINYLLCSSISLWPLNSMFIKCNIEICYQFIPEIVQW